MAVIVGNQLNIIELATRCVALTVPISPNSSGSSAFSQNNRRLFITDAHSREHHGANIPTNNLRSGSDFS